MILHSSVAGLSGVVHTTAGVRVASRHRIEHTECLKSLASNNNIGLMGSHREILTVFASFVLILPSVLLVL